MERCCNVVRLVFLKTLVLSVQGQKDEHLDAEDDAGIAIGGMYTPALLFFEGIILTIDYATQGVGKLYL